MLIVAPMLAALTAIESNPSVVLHSPDGRVVTAAKARTPVTLDGSLDEAVWRAAEPTAEFIQAEPHEGQPATEGLIVNLIERGPYES